MPGEWLEQLEHALVVRSGLAGEGPCDDVREVVVAHADGVGVAQCDAANFRRRPLPDTGNRSQAAVELVGAELDRALEAVGDDRTAMDRLGASPLDAQSMEDVGRGLEQSNG